jgi:hypothetical protein
MFITGTYNLAQDYNMMLDKSIIDCFEEVPVSQQTLAELIASMETTSPSTTSTAAAAPAAAPAAGRDRSSSKKGGRRALKKRR